MTMPKKKIKKKKIRGCARAEKKVHFAKIRGEIAIGHQGSPVGGKNVWPTPINFLPPTFSPKTPTPYLLPLGGSPYKNGGCSVFSKNTIGHQGSPLGGQNI